MFVCGPCHTDTQHIFLDHVIEFNGEVLGVSVGPCEVCQNIADCVDCKGPLGPKADRIRALLTLLAEGRLGSA